MKDGRKPRKYTDIELWIHATFGNYIWYIPYSQLHKLIYLKCPAIP